jgi:hypothetical protein
MVRGYVDDRGADRRDGLSTEPSRRQYEITGGVTGTMFEHRYEIVVRFGRYPVGMRKIKLISYLCHMITILAMDGGGSQ